jgi:hypothetical protein
MMTIWCQCAVPLIVDSGVNDWARLGLPSYAIATSYVRSKCSIFDFFFGNTSSCADGLAHRFLDLHILLLDVTEGLSS